MESRSSLEGEAEKLVPAQLLVTPDEYPGKGDIPGFTFGSTMFAQNRQGPPDIDPRMRPLFRRTVHALNSHP